MPHARHPLRRAEFPEHQEQLRALLASDRAHFGQLAERYEALDKRIYAVEDGREPLDGAALQTLKNQRVTLAEQIAERLRQAAPAAAELHRPQRMSNRHARTLLGRHPNLRE